MNKKTKALETIEGLCLMYAHSELDSEILGDIYEFAHYALGECDNPHEDWGKKLDELYDILKTNGTI